MLSKCDVLSYLHFLQTLGSCCIDLPDIEFVPRNPTPKAKTTNPLHFHIYQTIALKMTIIY